MKKRIHFLGIGGSGASAAAAIAEAQGFEVTGCDLEPKNEFTTQFKPTQLLTGHSASHLEGGNADILAVTPAIYSLDPQNPELMEAKKLGIPILTWQQFVGAYLTKNKFVVAICGTHGKTTTTAMIAQMLEDAKLDPTVLLGAINPRWKTNYRLGKSKYFIVEADEFNDNFLPYFPEMTVVTNIEMDHPEYFKDINSYMDSFEKFLLQTKQIIVANLADKNIAEIIKDVMKQSRISALDFNKLDINLDLKIPGKHNLANAKAAFQIGLLLGIMPERIRQSLNSYPGVGRRFEYLGNFQGAKVYSDFGHHPTEIKTTLEAARVKFPNQKIYLFYQPHMFSRTKVLFDDFVQVFKSLPVEKIVILDIYPSREKDTGLVNSQELVKEVNKQHVSYGKLENIKEEIKQYAKPGEILIFMGAGDIDNTARGLVSLPE